MAVRTVRLFLALVALGPAAAMAPACKTNTIDNATNNTTVNATTVGATGGIVVGPNNVQVRVPGGALTGDTRISIRVADPAEHPTFAAGEAVDGSVYALEPHGLKFLSPVTLSLPADTSRGATVYHAEVGEPRWSLVQNATLTSKGVEFVVTTFSYFAVTHPDFGGGTGTPNTAPSTPGTPSGSGSGGSSGGSGTCGMPALPCCTSGTPCNSGSACVAGTCTDCGREGAACCPGNTCVDPQKAVCDANICKPCGVPGQPCCAAATKCLQGSCNGSNICQ